MLDTATWRANPDWGAQLGYDRDALAAVNGDAAGSPTSSRKDGRM